MPIAVYGAGGIGCYVGGLLVAGGAEVVFVGRHRMADEVARCGLHLGADLRATGDVLREHLPEQLVLTGMVPFNVLTKGGGEFHQGTQGGPDVQQDAALTPYVDRRRTA